MLLVIVNSHASPAYATQDPPLQQRHSLAGRSLPTLPPETKRVVGQTLLIGLEPLPGDVGGMLIRQDDRPLLPGYGAGEAGTIRAPACPASAIDEGSGIAWIVQNLKQA